jgi:hypothetical protein
VRLECKKIPQQVRWEALAAYCKQRLRCATLSNLLGTFFTIALTRIVTVRRIFLGRILLVGALSAFVWTGQPFQWASVAAAENPFQFRFP